MEGGKILESTTEESLGIYETKCVKSVVRYWRDPTCRRKVKVIREIVIIAGGSRRVHSTKDDNGTNHYLG